MYTSLQRHAQRHWEHIRYVIRYITQDDDGHISRDIDGCITRNDVPRLTYILQYILQYILPLISQAHLPNGHGEHQSEASLNLAKRSMPWCCLNQNGRGTNGVGQRRS